MSLFNGKDLTGWTGKTEHFAVKPDGILAYDKQKGRDGNLYTEKEYDNFVFRFDFKLKAGANNGIGIRVPLEGPPHEAGFEIQILDNTWEKITSGKKKLKPYQYHGSIYGIAPAKQGYLKPVGEWNHEEIIADGDIITVILNGTVIVDNYDVSDCGRPKKGHIAFLGHHSYVEFRNIEIKELGAGLANAESGAPDGFTPLFDGKTLNGWKGILAKPYDKPHKRRDLSKDELARLQAEADENMKEHWKVEDGVIAFDGKGASLCTVKEYGDFELYVDWKITEKGDSGIYLRGLPQVQIWDRPEGSGALWNNKKAGNKPLVVADNPVGEWNTFKIRMVGDKVSVILNDKLVVDEVELENLWEKGKPIPAKGQIELQSHKSPLWFRNIKIKEL